MFVWPKQKTGNICQKGGFAQKKETHVPPFWFGFFHTFDTSPRASKFKGDSRDPQQWDPLASIRIPKDMGMVWEAYHNKGGPIVGGP